MTYLVSRSTAYIIFIIHSLMACMILVGCAGVGGVLKSSTLSMAEYLTRYDEKELYHAIRCGSSGGATQQTLYSYFLYKEPIVVRKVICQYEMVDKMSLKHVLADYARVTGAVLDDNIIESGRPVIREFSHNGSFAGYSVGSFGLSITLWNVTPPHTISSIILDLECSDQRGGTSAGPGLMYRK